VRDSMGANGGTCASYRTATLKGPFASAWFHLNSSRAAPSIEMILNSLYWLHNLVISRIA